MLSGTGSSSRSRPMGRSCRNSVCTLFSMQSRYAWSNANMRNAPSPPARNPYETKAKGESRRVAMATVAVREKNKGPTGCRSRYFLFCCSVFLLPFLAINFLPKQTNLAFPVPAKPSSSAHLPARYYTMDPSPIIRICSDSGGNAAPVVVWYC